MSQTLTAPAEAAPRDADVAFEELYRSSRDDVYGYVAGLLRDRHAAEDVTAAASRGPTASAPSTTRAAESRGPGSSASPATQPWTSCAGGGARQR